jgi:hypothetical protein
MARLDNPEARDAVYRNQRRIRGARVRFQRCRINPDRLACDQARVGACRHGGHVTDWLEFHDSTLTGFDAGEAHVELLLDAYIHRWETLNEGWRGTGWMQNVRIVVSNAIVLSAVPLLPVEISDGRLQLGAVAPNDLVLPLQASGAIRIWLQLTTADVVEVTGNAVRIEVTADARYIEELPADLRPKDLG